MSGFLQICKRLFAPHVPNKKINDSFGSLPGREAHRYGAKVNRQDQG
jgi:hypothetical protein